MKEPVIPANSLWGGRFENGVSDIMKKINASIDFDKILYRNDIKGSVEHCKMLVTRKIISKEDGEAIIKGLAQVEEEIEQDNVTTHPCRCKSGQRRPFGWQPTDCIPCWP